MVISLQYGQIMTPSEQDGYGAIETVLKAAGYAAPTNADHTQVAINSFIGSKQNASFVRKK